MPTRLVAAHRIAARQSSLSHVLPVSVPVSRVAVAPNADQLNDQIRYAISAGRADVLLTLYYNVCNNELYCIVRQLVHTDGF